MDRQIQTVRRFQAVLGVVFDQYRPGLPEFLRAMFYRPRWKLFITLEKFVLQADGAVKLAEEYPGGMKQLRRDCRLYIGEPPETVLAKRRFQLATVWLRCDHPIDDVGKALGFASTKKIPVLLCRPERTQLHRGAVDDADHRPGARGIGGDAAAVLVAERQADQRADSGDERF